MKILIFALLIVSGLNAQKRVDLQDDMMVRDFIFEIINSFENINSEKYNSIHGIDLTLNEKGNLLCFKLTFGDKNIQLSKKEYKWFYKKLKVGNYSKFIINHNNPIEIENSKVFKLSLRYIPQKLP